MDRRAFLKAVVAVPLAGCAPLGVATVPRLVSPIPRSVLDEAFARMVCHGRLELVLLRATANQNPFGLSFHVRDQWSEATLRERKADGRPVLRCPDVRQAAARLERE